jgi:hypothetical protein
MKVKYVSIFAVVLVVFCGMPALSGGNGIINYAIAKYATNTQSQGNSNDCITGTNCAIISPQTQGDGTANSPTNLQISKFNEDQVGEPGAGQDECDIPFKFCVRNCIQYPDETAILCEWLWPKTGLFYCSLLSGTCFGLSGEDKIAYACETMPKPMLGPQALRCV